ncbi:MAG: hypothetical protein ACRDE2_06945, partial [Chitinophagaceae bacterium]
MNKFCFAGTLAFVFTIITVYSSAQSNSSISNPDSSNLSDSTVKIPEVIAPDITIVMPGTKICQLVGEYDRQLHQYTQNRTYSRYRLISTDLG